MLEECWTYFGAGKLGKLQTVKRVLKKEQYHSMF